MTSNIERTIQSVCDEGLIAIVSGNLPVSKLLEVGDALLASPVLIMEVALNMGGAPDGITLLRERFGDNMLVGAGTVRSVEQFDHAVAAGAQFTASSNLDMPTVERALERDILHIPVVLTPLEVEVAYRAGCRMVQIFPSDIVGPRYLKAVRGPLDDILFVPVGDITQDNIGVYVRAGVAAIGLGSALVTGPDQPMDDLIIRARKIRAAWVQAKSARRSPLRRGPARERDHVT